MRIAVIISVCIAAIAILLLVKQRAQPLRATDRPIVLGQQRTNTQTGLLVFDLVVTNRSNRDIWVDNTASVLLGRSSNMVGTATITSLQIRPHSSVIVSSIQVATNNPVRYCIQYAPTTKLHRYRQFVPRIFSWACPTPTSFVQCWSDWIPN